MDAEERKRGIAAVFGRAAESYDEVVPYFSVFGAELVRRVGVRPGDVVLDLAAGRGAATFPAAETAARVLAGDLAPEMVSRLAADAAARGLGNVEARVMDAEEPDVEASVDVVLCAFAVFLLPDPAAAVRRWRTLLRPGGRVGVTTFAGHEERWGAVNAVLAAHAPAYLRPDPDADPGPVGTPDRLAETLRAAGYADVAVEVVGHDVRFASADQWWAWSWSHGRRAWLEPLGPDELETVRREAGVALAEIADADGGLLLRQDVCYAVGRA